MSKKNKKSSDSFSELLELILKTDDKKPISIEPHVEVLSNSERGIDAICQTLLTQSGVYNPTVTIGKIEEYLKEKENPRILYSKITKFIYDIDSGAEDGIKEGIYNTNISRLVEYALDANNNVPQNVVDEVVKIFDHSMLAIHQKNNVKNHLRSSLKKTKEEIKDSVTKEVTEEVTEDVKKYEKEYITILGIFAAIIVAFVGGITFSSSVLNNIDKVSVFRLVLVIDLLAFILTNALYLLICFIGKINNKTVDKKALLFLNAIYAIILCAIIIFWGIGSGEIIEYIQKVFKVKDKVEPNSIQNSTEENIKSFIQLLKIRK